VKVYTQAIVDSKDILTTGDRTDPAKKLYATLIGTGPEANSRPNSRVILLPDGSLYGIELRDAYLRPDFNHTIGLKM